MTKADKIEGVILKIIGIGAAFWTTIALREAAKRKATEDYYAEENGTGGIGAAERIKRRIYKEISLAQDAGIDFLKDYSQFTDEEIATLEELGHAASWEQKEQKPYAQAYFESLQKAYNAISGVGIGRAYSIKDANGNTVLTWIEDAAAHVAHEREIEEKRQRTLELEKEAEAARKKARSTKRAIERGQMSLFGIGGNIPVYTDSLWNRYISTNAITDAAVDLSNRDKKGRYYILCGDPTGGRDFYAGKELVKKIRRYCAWHCLPFDFCNGGVSGTGALNTRDLLEPELIEFIRQRVDDRRMSIAYDEIDERRCPLQMAEPVLYDQIFDLVEEWCMNNAIDPDSVWGVIDVEDIFWEL